MPTIKVPNMEMPKSCYDCIFNHGEYDENYIEKRYCAMRYVKWFNKRHYKKRPKECRLEIIAE